MRPRAGFSLAEALVSCSLVVVAVLTLMQVFPTTRKSLQQSEARTYAAFLGQTLLQDARRQGFGAIGASAGRREYSGLDNDASHALSIDYRLDVEPLEVGTKRVWATMTWHEPTGDKRLVMETIVARTR